MDLQFALVVLVVLVAAVYSARRFLRQFSVSEDEPSACAKCAAARPPAPTSEENAPVALTRKDERVSNGRQASSVTELPSRG